MRREFVFPHRHGNLSKRLLYYQDHMPLMNRSFSWWRILFSTISQHIETPQVKKVKRLASWRFAKKKRIYIIQLQSRDKLAWTFAHEFFTGKTLG